MKVGGQGSDLAISCSTASISARASFARVRVGTKMFACLYRPPAPDVPATSTPKGADLPETPVLERIAGEFSPRYELHGDHLISIDVGGLERLLGEPLTIAHELRRDAAERGERVHVAIAGTQIAAVVLALARPGITVVRRGDEAEALAPVPLSILAAAHETKHGDPSQRSPGTPKTVDRTDAASSVVAALKRWGLKTLGELAALPSADLAARLGQEGLACQAIARGEDLHPLVPTLADERFASSLELEWPIEGAEPLSFVLTRLLEPLTTRLERRDRGAAVLHVQLGLVTKAVHARRLELPAPLRDVRTLRTLVLVDLESHPPPAAIDTVSIVIDPTPARVLQHTLYSRAHPTPEAISTLLARLGALMGQDRIGAPAPVDTHRPGAFTMRPFATCHDGDRRKPRREGVSESSAAVATTHHDRLIAVLRRFRLPVPARVIVATDRPIRVTTDRRGFPGGSVFMAAGPWRTSGDWWAGGAGRAGEAGRAEAEGDLPLLPSWDRDEWDVALSDGAVYRIFQDRETGGWFIDGIVD